MKRILLYILTLSMLVAACNFGTLPAEALVQTGSAPAGYTAVSTEEELRTMATGGKYYLANDITLTQPLVFPANITFNGNGHALLPPVGTNRENPILQAGMSYDTKSSYPTYCYFSFSNGSTAVTFENVSFGTAQRPFCLYNDKNDTNGSGLALFPTSWGVTTLTCTNVDFYTYIKEDAGSGNNAGFMSAVYNTVIMTNCNMLCEVDAEKNQFQAGGFFAQTATTTTVKLTMSGCTVLSGSYIHKSGQSGGFIGQSSGTLSFTNCVNYADVLGKGDFTGGILAEFFSSSNAGNGGIALTLTKCRNYGTIQGYNSVGGLVGDLHGDSSVAALNITLTDCMNAGWVGPAPATTDANGTVTYHGERVGGLVGRISRTAIKLTFNNCVNLGTVHGPEELTTDMYGYMYANVGQFVGGLLQHCGSKDANGNFVPNPGTGSDPYYGAADTAWKWHMLYNAQTVKITNSYAYGRIVLPSHAKAFDSATGLDGTAALTLGAIANYGFFGHWIKADSTSSGNHQLTTNNSAETGKWSYSAEVPQAPSVGVGLLNTWLANQGINEEYYIDDRSSAKTYPYVNAKPAINAYLTTATHDTIRIIGSINTLKYNKVGFTYSMTVNGAAEFTNQTIWTTSAYKDVGLKTADQLGCEYLYETTFINLPTDKVVVLTIIPKGVLTSGTEIVGQTYTLTFTNGKFTKCTVT